MFRFKNCHKKKKNIFNTNEVQVQVYLFSILSSLGILQANLQAALPTNNRVNLGG